MLLELEKLDWLMACKARMRRRLAELAKQFPIVARLQAMPGCGLISAVRLVAYIGDPHRFSSKRKLWRYARLGIVRPEDRGQAHRPREAGQAGLRVAQGRKPHHLQPRLCHQEG